MNQPNFVPDDEIDLRQYLNIVIKYRYWIIGLAILSAVVAFVASSFLPETYEAKALVTATQSRYELQFDPRFRDVPDSALQSLLQGQYLTYPTLARSDSLLEQVAETVDWDLEDLKDNTEANALTSTPNMLILTVKGENAAETAEVANTWAQVFVATVNDLYGGGDELDRYKQQKDAVGQSLAQADRALTNFRKENGFGFSTDTETGIDLGLIGQQLQSKTDLLTSYEVELIHIQQRQREVETLSQAASENNSPVLVAGLLAEMINTGIIQEPTSYQIKFDSVEPAAALAAMKEALQGRKTAIEAEMEPLEADISTLQTELATQQEVLEQLIRDQEVKAETYAVISRKVQEAQIVSFSEEGNTGSVAIASPAIAPVEPLSSGRLRNTLVAGVLGLMVGVIGVFVLEWWRMDVNFGDSEQHLQSSTYQATVER